MPKKSDVEFNLSGLDGITPTGFSVTYTVGEIPTAQLEFAPGKVDPKDLKITPNDAGSFIDAVEKNKRKDDVEVNIKITTNIANKQTKEHQLKFVGFLDGLSVTNSVGQNSYTAILKNKAQTLLEISVMTPGLYPSSMNIYKIPSFGVTLQAGGEENQRMKGWTYLFDQKKTISWGKTPIEVYTEIMKKLLEEQLGGWAGNLGTDKTILGTEVMQDVFNDPRYKKALETASSFMNSIDLSAVIDQDKQGKVSWDEVAKGLANIFAQGPSIFLENYLYFLHQLDVTLIFGNTRIWAVPVNSMIRQELTEPSRQQLQSKPNRAYPADYVSFTYNDAGYRDIAGVIVSTSKMVAGTYLGGDTFERGYPITYMEDKQLSQASGVLVIQVHPWLFPHPTGASSNQVPETRQQADTQSPMQGGSKEYSGAKSEAKGKAKSEEEKKKGAYQSELTKCLKNYAETKFYQARFADRTGSIVMDFNTEWVPGTSGLLYIHETKLWLQFYVVSVTHKVDLSPPSNGTAITIVSYRCGRIGKEPAATEKDNYLGYDKEREDGVRQQWIGDTK